MLNSQYCNISLTHWYCAELGSPIRVPIGYVLICYVAIVVDVCL